MAHEKFVERDRYDERARRGMSAVGSGALHVRPALRAPYVAYERSLKECVSPGSRVLEIGAGTGEFTAASLSAGGKVIASDISRFSLAVLEKRYGSNAALRTCVADMESLPFPRLSFDVIASAGALSYGDGVRVREEVFRVLAPGGVFVCVDSLNHNPVYRLNRWWHFQRGRRSASTLRRMPTLSLIDAYRQRFGAAQVEFFGAISWAAPLVSKFLGESMAARCVDRFDRAVGVRRSAFKFVMVARKTAHD